MQEIYQPLEIEQKVQQLWEETGVFKAKDDNAAEKFYCLSMFPYPSGKLHMGHVRNYTIGDVISRYQRMLGKNVLQPMGWDAFGLPAENAAMQHGVHPADWTYSNIDYMRDQLKRLGFGYDWSREIATCDPAYYQWEQWFFLKLLGKNLAYKKTAPVNWCPKDMTVLANEQVIEGCCWRCDTPVERREISQWFLKITDYAEELLTDLDKLDGWPEQVKTMQANWIGKSYGVRFAFPYQLNGKDELLWVYTTRADTIMGVTFCAVAAAHPLALHAAKNNPELAAFLKECEQSGTAEADMATMEKKGMPTGVNVAHPLTGEQIPVWVGNYVLMSYGEGAVMAVPAHDERDFYFANKYDLPIIQVLDASGGLNEGESPFDSNNWQSWYASKEDRLVLVNSRKYNGLTHKAAVDAIAEDLKAKNLGDKQVQYRLRDWGVSRQRYWGAPIPVIYCNDCGTVPVPEKDLPVTLPRTSFNPIGFDTSRIAGNDNWVDVKCPKCSKAARRETDTFDTFMESSWYFARFASQPDNAMLDEKAKQWLPVDHYIGGIEHAILHLLYSRFYHKLLRDAGLVSCDEPFKKLLTQGMVVAETFYQLDANGHKQFINPAQIEVEHDKKGKIVSAKLLSDGSPVIVGNVEKMAKSKNNGVDPQVMIDQYGADTVRLFIMFAAPPEQSLEWSDSGVEGASRFLKRLWRQVYLHVSNGAAAQALDKTTLTGEQQAVRRQLHQAIQKVSHDMGVRTIYNTAIAANMELINTLAKFEDASTNGKAIKQEALEAIVLMLAPIVPHICHELWLYLGKDGAVVNQCWPAYDESALAQDSIDYVLQVNGKLRGKITVSAAAANSEIEHTALADEHMVKFIDGRPVKKVIIVPKKLVNIVV